MIVVSPRRRKDAGVGKRETSLETVGGVWYGMVVSSGGSNSPSELRTLDPFAGTSTLIGLSGVDEIEGLAYDGTTMYAVEGGNADGDLYTVDLGTGAVTVVGNTGIRAGSLEFGPDGRLYAGGVGPDGGNLYTINTSTGASTLVGATGFGAVSGLALVDDSVFDCTTTVLGADGQGGVPGNLYSFDPLSGALIATVGAVGYPVTGLADHPVTCALWGVTSPTFDAANNPNPGHLITIDKSTGAGALVGDVLAATDAGPTDITFTSNGTLYGWSSDTDDLITIDLGTGAGTVVGDSGLASSGVGLAASSSDQLHLAGDGGAPGSSLTLINALAGIPTGRTALSGDLVAGSSIVAMDFGCNGLILGVHSLGAGVTNLVTINTGTGALSTLGSTQSGLDAIVGVCKPSPPTAFYTLDPCRLIDTRNATGPLGGPALVAGADRTFTIANACGVPATATAISVNIAVTASTGRETCACIRAELPFPRSRRSTMWRDKHVPTTRSCR